MVAVSFSVLVVIPARGGSSRVPRKNILPILGLPLIGYSIYQAKKCPSIMRVIVSTDNEEIANVAREYGAEVPFMRPKELAENLTPDLPVFQQALRWLEDHQGYRPEVIVHLRPTTPTRRIQDIERAIEMLASRPEADSVRSVMEPPQSPYKMFTKNREGFLEPVVTLPDVREPYNLPQQKLPTAYMHRGVVDVMRRRTILELNSMTGRRILPYVLKGDYRSLNIPEDIPAIEQALKSGNWDIPHG